MRSIFSTALRAVPIQLGGLAPKIFRKHSNFDPKIPFRDLFQGNLQ